MSKAKKRAKEQLAAAKRDLSAFDIENPNASPEARGCWVDAVRRAQEAVENSP